MNDLEMSHEDAVREVYRLTPQIREYDEFMYLGVRWMPYTMFFQHPNYRSDVITTDRLGFRRSVTDQEVLEVAEVGKETINLIVGGSTVLGTGATSDRWTLASCLGNNRGERWLNFSCRGYNATQELLLFLMHHQRFQAIDHVVVFSGLNTLSLEGLPEEFNSDHGRYYYSYEFEHYMQKYNDDLRKRKHTYSSELDARGKQPLAKVKSWLGQLQTKENPADKIIFDEDVPVEARVARAAKATVDALENWQLLLVPFKAKLSFFLQPMASWTKDRLHAEEEEIFRAIDSCPNNFWRLFRNILGPEIHPLYAEMIRRECERIGVAFHDMNVMMRHSDFVDDYVFVDRVHFNDGGHRSVAGLISDAIG